MLRRDLQPLFDSDTLPGAAKKTTEALLDGYEFKGNVEKIKKVLDDEEE